MEAPLAYLTLFFTAFAAATLLPAYSELLLGTLASQGRPLFWLWFWATLGNTLGSVVNGLIAGRVDRFRQKRGFRVGELRLHRAATRLNGNGQGPLLLGGRPFVGAR